MLAPRPEAARFTPAAPILAAASVALLPPERITVADAAERYRVLADGPWRNARTPYLVEPMNRLGSGEVELVVIMGPAQTGKSEVGNNWLLHTVLADPADLLWLGTDKAMVADYVKRRVGPMIDSCPELRRRLRADRHADNLLDKAFVGARVTFIWPVGSQLRARPVPRFVVDDFDDVPEDIEGQGDPITLLNARQRAFEGRDVGLVISSPNLGTGRGIEGWYERGTGKTWRWRCPECGAWWSPDLLRDLRFERTRDPEEARKTAAVVCPVNGCVIDRRRKAGMLAGGRWAEPQQEVTGEGAITGEPSGNPIESYRIDGLMGFTKWPRLAAELRRAELAFELRQDEAPLRTYINTVVGRNYSSRLAEGEPPTPHELAARREAFALGAVPAGVVALTAAIDVQVDRFEVMVVGWGQAFESWIVDRFAVTELEEGRGRVRPATHGEHWNGLLQRVLWRKYPLAADPTRTLPILNVAVDSGGLEGVSANAVRFWHAARAVGVADRSLMLVKGGSARNARLVPPPSRLEATARGDKPSKRSAKLFVINVHRLKDIVDARLRRADPGPGYVHLPAGFDERWLEELVAEERTDKGWERTGPNETWDLAVYCLAAWLRHVGERGDMGRVPSWARAPRIEAAAASPSPAPAPATERTAPAPRRAPARRTWMESWRR